ncbi:Pentatricopeptide repeat-containing protein -mitochondrial [Striga hermonthica]|uniref:Pentatricopeptide repeat-containing protein -mitochondrial n=1 Tax=Striga hermonthica TaxID=68872 RepID=A0A9N7NEL9_STRHE|nr:Pentatricopeptide repeat-containing protein -mitochondrial [Striga hermonthica]
MLSKSKHLYPLSRYWARSCLDSYRRDYVNHNYCRITTLFHNPFSSSAEPVKTSDKPELPGWVNYPVKDKNASNLKDEDFVPPSLSSWIENQHSAAQRDDIFESDVDKISNILTGHFKSPDSVVKALEACDVDLSNDLVEQVLCRFSSEWVPSLGFFKWVELRNGFKHPPNIYNLMVNNLGKVKKFELMWDLAEEMKNLEGYFTLDTMTKIMRRLAKARKYEDAIEAFENSELFGIEKDTSALNRLIEALVYQGSVEHGEQAYFKFKENIPPSQQTFNILVQGWCKMKQMGKAKETVNEMLAHGFGPNLLTYTSFIRTYCCEKDFRKVDATLAVMEREGIYPNVVTYTIMMKSYEKAKEFKKAMEVYELTKKNNCPPDASLYTAFIGILGRMSRVEDAYEVFDAMSRQGVDPNVSTYNMLIFISASRCQEEKALTLLKIMEENKCKPNFNTYGPLLKMCCRLGRMKVLTFLLSYMFKNNVSLDPTTYSLLVGLLCRNGNAARACSFFEEMVDKGLVPTDGSYVGLVKALDEKGLLEEKERVKKAMSRFKEGFE